MSCHRQTLEWEERGPLSDETGRGGEDCRNTQLGGFPWATENLSSALSQSVHDSHLRRSRAASFQNPPEGRDSNCCSRAPGSFSGPKDVQEPLALHLLAASLWWGHHPWPVGASLLRRGTWTLLATCAPILALFLLSPDQDHGLQEL